VSVAGELLNSGDGVAIENAETLELKSREGAQILLFEPQSDDRIFKFRRGGVRESYAQNSDNG